jgi:hypothetical protein
MITEQKRSSQNMSNQKKKAKFSFPKVDIQFLFFTLAIFGTISYLGQFFTFPLKIVINTPFGLLWLFVSWKLSNEDEERQKLWNQLMGEN